MFNVEIFMCSRAMEATKTITTKGKRKWCFLFNCTGEMDQYSPNKILELQNDLV